jgi:hypothetical protein
MSFPTATSSGAENLPKGRVVRYGDSTVPERQYLKTVFNVDGLKDEYPSHARVVHHVSDAACSLGYAVTQAGARRLLYWLGLMEMTSAFDLMLRQFCEGIEGKDYHNCLTVQPALFQHHRPAGNKTFESDISSHGTEYREKAMTEVIRWAVRMNTRVLLDGRTDFEDQFPDREWANTVLHLQRFWTEGKTWRFCDLSSTSSWDGRGFISLNEWGAEWRWERHHSAEEHDRSKSQKRRTDGGFEDEDDGWDGSPSIRERMMFAKDRGAWERGWKSRAEGLARSQDPKGWRWRIL